MFLKLSTLSIKIAVAPLSNLICQKLPHGDFPLQLKFTTVVNVPATKIMHYDDNKTTIDESSGVEK
jgi:hypothetical protein